MPEGPRESLWRGEVPASVENQLQKTSEGRQSGRKQSPVIFSYKYRSENEIASFDIETLKRQHRVPLSCIRMAFVHASSCECNKSELDLFTVPPTQTAIEASQWIEHRPITSLTDHGTIEFVIMGSCDECVDLLETLLQVTA